MLEFASLSKQLEIQRETFSASFQDVRVQLAEIQKQLEHRTTEEETQPSVSQQVFAPTIAIEQITVSFYITNGLQFISCSH